VIKSLQQCIDGEHAWEKIFAPFLRLFGPFSRLFRAYCPFFAPFSRLFRAFLRLFGAFFIPFLAPCEHVFAFLSIYFQTFGEK
jgi:hypothetical protein